jgi:hypothetical protein
MKVLVACEFSGIVRDAFIAKGHDAWSCDLLPTEKLGNHIQDDVLKHLNDGWDLMIAHPPCIYLANSGVCHLYNKDKTFNAVRWQKMREASEFFVKLWCADIPKICLENSIMHVHSRYETGSGFMHRQIIHPWQFGHMEQKPTCLFLNGLPDLTPTNDVKKEMKKLPANKRQRIHYMPPSDHRQKDRSVTYQGIADAMADQWGELRQAGEP